jgi:2-oxoglutarate dehydrogenase E1 component
VHGSWATYFRLVNAGAVPGAANQVPPTLRGTVASPPSLAELVAAGRGVAAAAMPSDRVIRDHHNVALLIRAHQVRGHATARLDPLGGRVTFGDPDPPELKPETYGFTEAGTRRPLCPRSVGRTARAGVCVCMLADASACVLGGGAWADLDRTFTLGSDQVVGVLSEGHLTLRDLLARLRATYCDTIGYEYMHIKNRRECNWIRDRIERPRPPLTAEEQRLILDRLLWADHFERYAPRTDATRTERHRE